MPFRDFQFAELQGLNEDDNPSSLLPGQLRVAINTARKGRLTGTRPGYTRDPNSGDYDAAISGTPTILGMYEFRIDRDATRTLVVVADDGAVYENDTTAITQDGAVTVTSSPTATASDYWDFAVYQDKLFATGGDPGSNDSFWYWDGSNNIMDIDVVDHARYVFSKFNFLFLGGLKGSTASDNPLVARYNNYGTDATSAAKWPDANTIPGQLPGENSGAGSYGEEFNTGFGEYQDNRGDFLLFLTNRRILAIQPNPALTGNADFFRTVDTIATGCVSQRAFVNLGVDYGDCIYMSDRGIHSLRRSQENGGTNVTSFLSWPIRKTFGTLNRSRLDDSVGVFLPQEALVLFFVSTGSNTTHDLCLALDLKDVREITSASARWYLWYFAGGLQPNAVQLVRDPTTDIPYVYIGDTSGSVWRIDPDVYTDNSNGYSVRFRPRDEDFGNPAMDKAIGDTFITVSANSDFKFGMRPVLDYGSRTGLVEQIDTDRVSSLWGTAIWGQSKWSSTGRPSIQRVEGSGEATTISPEFFHSGTGEAFWIGSLVHKVAFIGEATDSGGNE